jgi:glycosyltransferase involved in cell wall biosynthesis
MKLSLVVPCFNEEEVLPEFINRTLKSLEKFEDFEVIFIDDGSTDNSLQILSMAAANDEKIKCVKLSRNFGHQFAVLAGLSHSSFDLIGIIDADLQDPPEILFQMAKKIESGFDVVYGQRISREGETFFKKFTASLFYRILALLSPISIPRDAGDFRVVTRRAADSVIEMNESNPFLRGLFAFTGFNSFAFSYKREERFAGSTKYTLKKMYSLASNAIIGFSGAPLKIFSRLSQALLFISLVVGAYAIFRAIEVGSPNGWLSVFSAILFFGALNLAFLSLIAGYLLSVLTSVQNRPKFVVDKTINFN